jgi:uncharacterized protein (DUF58 family)
MATSFLERWWQGLDKPGWRSFAVAMVALSIALVLALYSAAAAELGRTWLAGALALAALGLAFWVAVTIVPKLAQRTPLRWLAYHIDYRLPREGVVYLLGILFIFLAAMNSGNNLLFMILASMIAGILVSGILSSIVLTGVELTLKLPEHIFAEQPILAALELHNEKLSLPSFSLRVVGDEKRMQGQILTRPVYFPYIPRRRAVRQQVELTFPRRGVYRQGAFGIRTKFTFGFLQKTRKVDSEMEVVVYPRVEPTEEFYEILPLLSGELESFYRGRGHDLYAIRDYLPTDSARFVDWKASAKTSTLKVREFTREDERRGMLVLDPCLDLKRGTAPRLAPDELEAKFERAVTFCACLAWHFYEIDSEMQFLTRGWSTPMTTAGEIIYDVLRQLAFVKPEREEGDGKFLLQLTEEPDLFKIILTNQPRGSIPTSLWTSSYFIFLESL